MSGSSSHEQRLRRSTRSTRSRIRSARNAPPRLQTLCDFVVPLPGSFGLERPVDDRRGGVDEHALSASGVVARIWNARSSSTEWRSMRIPLARSVIVRALESSFKVTVFGEAPQDDLDRVLPLLRVAIRDCRRRRRDSPPGLRSRDPLVQECDDRAGRLVNDLFDQFERVLRNSRRGQRRQRPAVRARSPVQLR